MNAAEIRALPGEFDKMEPRYGNGRLEALKIALLVEMAAQLAEIHVQLARCADIFDLRFEEMSRRGPQL